MAKQSDEESANKKPESTIMMYRVQRIPTDQDQYTKREKNKEISVHHIFLN